MHYRIEIEDKKIARKLMQNKDIEKVILITKNPKLVAGIKRLDNIKIVKEEEI
ncbi:hypothetical protein [Saccharolobus islandicus]|uniref:Uncharacterized protein n=1 Tax=Saccharolobus islandicus TaxID=43080 RepID=Q5W300_SACIS|nr:hypothetical protein [Sulfolobus islandicus]CAG38146.1 hypothetical protein [Sulfolobus islandicus]